MSVILLITVNLHTSIGQQPNRFFSSGDSLFVGMHPGNDMYYSHEVAKGTTLYNLAQVFDINEQQIRIANQLKYNESLRLGEIVKVPLAKSRILTKKPKGQYYKVMYVVRPKETLYSISKSFNLNAQTILTLNQKKTSGLTVHETLLLGYINVKESKNIRLDPDQVPPVPSAPGMPNPVIIKQVNINEPNSTENDEKFVSEEIIAGWDKHSVASSSLIVLHNKAKIGSMLEIRYPMMQRAVKAKVVGRIPAGTYSEEISIWVSPATARALGALDNRFRVDVTYSN